MEKQRKSVLDVTIIHLLCIFETSLCKYIDEVMPKKFKPTYVVWMLEGLNSAIRLAVKAMDLPPWDKKRKYELLIECRGELRYAESRLLHLNSMESINDRAMSRFIIQLDEIYSNLERLLRSLLKKVSETETQSQDDASVLAN